MDRRRFLLTSMVGALAAPPGVEAQRAGRVSRVAYLGNSSAALEAELVSAFRQGLRDLGYVEGRNVLIQYGWAEGQYDRLPALVAEAVRSKVDVIVTAGTPAVLAARDGTRDTPIVVAAMGDPIAAGVVPSLARPGGNITGSASMTPDIDGKRLELLKEMVSTAFRFAVLWNPTNPNNAARMTQMQAAAKTLHITLEPAVGVSDALGLDKGFEVIVAGRAHAVIMESDRALLAHRARIVELAAKHRLPALYPYRDFVEAGGLTSYEPSYPAMFRRAAEYVDKILKGAKPADLPIQQPTRFELVINLRTAKALGLTMPPSLMLRADQVIE